MKKLPYPVTLLITLYLVASLALASAVFAREENLTIEASGATP